VTIENCSHYTFQEAFDRTGRIINITVAPVNDFDPPRLLNYLTAPHVCVWSAAVASCAIPGVFEPVPLIVREPDGRYAEEHVWSTGGAQGEGTGSEAQRDKSGGRYSDGSVESDLPMEQLAELFNVNHFIVSQVSLPFLLFSFLLLPCPPLGLSLFFLFCLQVNPHSPFLSAMTARASVWTPFLYTLSAGLLNYLKSSLRNSLKNFVDALSYYSIGPTWGSKRGLIQALTQVCPLLLSLLLLLCFILRTTDSHHLLSGKQDYSGRDCDVTLSPWYDSLSIPEALYVSLKVTSSPSSLSLVT
jgi:predicted acylesterase/phospholipase RssA